MGLFDKIRKIEALIAETQNEGERQAALLAKQRLQEKSNDEPREYTIRLKNRWSKHLFVAICRKYNLYTYRYAMTGLSTSKRLQTSLRSTSAAVMKITDDGLEHLKALTNLTSLYLSFCNKITDKGVESLLKDLKNLKISRR